ncbi:MAG: helix-turn-helix domain-containing protein [Nitrospirota bacterium]|nr:helix-turn-helix domain-containing protein [Nitrospirota bacterium]
MTRDIFLVHQDPLFLKDFEEKLSHNGTRVTPLQTKEALSKISDFPNAVLVIDIENDWEDALQTLENLKKEGLAFYAIVSTATLLKKTVSQIDSTSQALAQDTPSSAYNRRKTDRLGKPNFAELLEERLADFVRKIRASEGNNLYDLLIQEVEKPLISLALKETGGNQVQASQLLGMHRNTLRKKMRELQIPFGKKTAR